jgi:hypothetical protein
MAKRKNLVNSDQKQKIELNLFRDLCIRHAREAGVIGIGERFYTSFGFCSHRGYHINIIVHNANGSFTVQEFRLAMITKTTVQNCYPANKRTLNHETTKFHLPIGLRNAPLTGP